MLISNLLKRSSFQANKNLIKFPKKFVSSNPAAKENRDNRDFKKFEDIEESRINKMQQNLELSKQIEEKYKSKSEKFSTKNHSGDNKKIYYVPLTKSDEEILAENFSNAEMQNDIRKGGRIVLLDEVQKHNNENPQKKIELDFEPLDLKDLERIKRQYAFFLDDKELLIFLLQIGKKILPFLRNFEKNRLNILEENSYNFRKLDSYIDLENSNPLSSKISIELKKYENPEWIGKLLVNNNLKENDLVQKFNDIYFKYLECVNFELKEIENISLENNTDNNKNNKHNKQNKHNDFKEIDLNLKEKLRTFFEDQFDKGLKNILIKSNKKNIKSNIIESAVFKGIFQDRKFNNIPEAYYIIDNLEDLGIKYFYNKALSNNSNYVLQDPYLFSLRKKAFDPYEINSDKIQLIRKRDNNIVIRMYFQISNDKGKLIQINENNSEEKNKEISEKNCNHLLIFENELGSRNDLNLLNNDFSEWISTQNLNMDNWKLVDVDNFMKGNPFFLNRSSLENEYITSINNGEELINEMENTFNNIEINEVNSEINNENNEDNLLKANSDLENKEIKENTKEGKKSKKEKKKSKGENKENKGKEKQMTNLYNNYEIDYFYNEKQPDFMQKFIQDNLKFEEKMQAEFDKIGESDFFSDNLKEYEKTSNIYSELSKNQVEISEEESDIETKENQKEKENAKNNSKLEENLELEEEFYSFMEPEFFSFLRNVRKYLIF